MPSWMKIRLKPAVGTNLKLVLDFLRQSALRLQKKGVDQWQNWLNPSEEDLTWIKKGFESKEFFLSGKRKRRSPWCHSDYVKRFLVLGGTKRRGALYPFFDHFRKIFGSRK